ncbi:DUF6090 family protein [Winogradskyella alexanderae]|uniref:Uncharacterized protein n=1 Tax=Winogradskyella alexanderae TaxID=2877123 RepID=A0ABS7XNP7_9FLAO|nr:DUF6090 family protein [Winogradskyella alexanderae]MCA0131613.1 hypothetical protein [Winogradskyella alexanderae]
MIKFFRKIRQKLLSENKFSKYLLYAVGEIILVVIGILIALSINNWNENLKNKKEEISVLKELLSDSKTNLLSLEEDIFLNQRAINSNMLISDILINKRPYNDSLDIHFGNIQYNTQFTLNTGGYENLKSRGFEIISNDSLRKSIINIYDRWVDFIDDLGDMNNKVSLEQFNPSYKFYFKNFKRDLEGLYVSFKPQDYEKLIQNNEFLKLIREQKYNNEYTIQALDMGIKQIKELIAQLETELEK